MYPYINFLRCERLFLFLHTGSREPTDGISGVNSHFSFMLIKGFFFTIYTMLFNILQYSISSLIWGVLIATACIGLFVFLIKGWYKDATFSPISYIVGVVLFILLSYQCILIIGSLSILKVSDLYEQELVELVNQYFVPSDNVSLSDASAIVDRVIEKSPILQYDIGGGEFLGFTAAELPHAIVNELQSFMHWYIVRRLLWCLAFVVIGAFCVIKSMSKRHSSTQRQYIHTERKRVRRNTRHTKR